MKSIIDKLKLVILIFIFVTIASNCDFREAFESDEDEGFGDLYFLYREIIDCVTYNSAININQENGFYCITNKVENGYIYNMDTKEPITSDTINERINLACVDEFNNEGNSVLSIRSNEWYRSEIEEYPPGHRVKFLFQHSENTEPFNSYKDNDVLFCVTEYDVVYQKLIVKIEGD